MTHIGNIYVNAQERGLVLSFAKQARALPSAQGRDYVDAHRGQSLFGSLPETRDMRRRRGEVAQPTILGYFNNLPDGPDITADGITVKRPGSFNLGVPECFDFTLPMAGIVGSDVLQLYGAKKFRESEIVLIVQRTDVEKNDAHRPPFSGWHTHLSGPTNMDLIYSFCDVLPTEFKVGGKIKTVPENSLTRFGTEIEHRSQTNHGEDTLRRIWGAFIVSDGKPAPSRRNYGAFNCATNEDFILAFRRAARNYLTRTPTNFTPIEPAPLYAVA